MSNYIRTEDGGYDLNSTLTVFVMSPTSLSTVLTKPCDIVRS